MATYELVLDRTATASPADVVTDLPPVACDEVIFYGGRFWHVDAVEPALSQKADGRVVMSRTTDQPNPGTT